jgi:hypothetical protein
MKPETLKKHLKRTADFINKDNDFLKQKLQTLTEMEKITARQRIHLTVMTWNPRKE